MTLSRLTTMLAMLLLMAGSVLAQESVEGPDIDDLGEDDWSYSEPYIIQVGPFIGGASVGMNIEGSPEGRKSNPDFWFLGNYGVSALAPFGAGSRLGGRLDIGINTTGTRVRPYEFFGGQRNWDGYVIERFTYFSVAPRINLSGITLGAGFNFLMSAERWPPDFADAKHTVDPDLLKSMVIDLRLGGMIKAWQTDLGTLYADVEARWMLSGLYNDDSYYYGLAVNNRGTPTPAIQTDLKNIAPISLHVGISYLFNLGL